MDACLVKYPEHRESLRPLLEVAQALQEHEAAAGPFFLCAGTSEVHHRKRS